MYRFKEVKNNRWIIEKFYGLLRIGIWLPVKERYYSSRLIPLPPHIDIDNPEIKKFTTKNEAAVWLKNRGGRTARVVYRKYQFHF
ncbi:hypothetical protein A2303_06710 [Candidatus Falkowbacteria bacterium RIFOXYB2_FULL_47_14]|uniref:Uncharacterized protein n=1 Tax=Candidatus Falkowbacteria bacterium RIFOXYA2_FULL_47_19 TaxID=1797994 RepID=A0A1F5SG51_9BACT|nr:MAG: hypothetical protein A2227_00455 [Candidatus Falkowbacteria bacterium RIFOXYA2_FULL_47_19]OGF35529.1 MAG: hypothetical protein A2468_05820 [Candidatus Falkowbacteria bacterium RIFOXYC2_FULL_46_15]OGF43562.1 MAG: hypothetical protein A2303_06710 [Candidatus Falkowbacteria bacterium RIFOXYB2_FULL_47_14]